VDWYLLGYLAGGLIIGAVELVALFNRRDGDTLSEHVWKWVGIGRRWTIGFTLRRLVVVLFLGWLLLHLTLGWLTPSHPLPWR
jgi:hypothetical protein